MVLEGRVSINDDKEIVDGIIVTCSYSHAREYQVATIIIWKKAAISLKVRQLL